MPTDPATAPPAEGKFSLRALQCASLIAIGLILPLFFVEEDQFRRWGIPSPPIGPGYLEELWNLGHLAFFAAFGLASLLAPVFKNWGFRFWFLSLLLITVVAGGSIEFLQNLTGRSASLEDFQKNIAGMLIAASLIARPAFNLSGKRLTSLWGLTLAFALFQLIPLGEILIDEQRARQQFPLLSGFETDFEARRWDMGEISSLQHRSGLNSLRVTLRPGAFAGPALEHSLGDWSDYRQLHFSLLNPSGQLKELHVKIRDIENWKRGSPYSDAFNKVITLHAGWNDISLSIKDIEQAPKDRAMRLDDLLSLSLFFVNLKQEELIFLDDIRLSR